MTEVNKRTLNQYAADLIYRFPANNIFWIGARYNRLAADISDNRRDVAITRLVGSIGWFVKKNIMMKAEYIHQKHDHYDTDNILSEGSFKGFMAEASIGF